jgi:adenine-specific DNA-methyltransferase
VVAIRYIGSKARVAEEIIDVVGSPSSQGGFVDAFCGTGVVAAAAADRGWAIRINDHLLSATVITAARLTAVGDVPFEALGGYVRAAESLNVLDPIVGFITREYSPASRVHAGLERRYFTERNAGRIDAMRWQIRQWQLDGAVSGAEERLLLADLLAAANRVANIAGTYGCFLRHWSSTATRDVQLAPRVLRVEPVELEVHVGDVTGVPSKPHDVVYYDPPYTKRQYAAYYHILETIVAGDAPTIGGVTGLRPWQHLASDFCYRVRALGAIIDLIRGCPASRVLLSYSSQGHVPQEALEGALADLGELQVHRLGEIGRYRPNGAAVRAGGSVHEYVFDLRRPLRGKATEAVA